MEDIENEIPFKHIFFSVSKRIIFAASFFFITPLLLFASIIALVSLSSHSTDSNSTTPKVLGAQYPGVEIRASTQKNSKAISVQLVSGDARVIIVKNFLSSYNSPLAEHADAIISNADKYSIDWKLIPAIAIKESGGCRVIPDNSHNCWGWGIHSRGTLKFDSYDESIEAVTKGLKENYVDIGLVTVGDIMSKWVPHSPGGAWAVDVQAYMDEMN